MKKTKPQLEWKLAYFENGKRRLPVTKEEDRELDEIIKGSRDGQNAAANSAERMIQDAKKWRIDSNGNIRTLGAHLQKGASDLLSRITDGRSFVVELISCLRQHEFYCSIVESVRRTEARKDKRNNAPKTITVRRHAVLDPILDDTQKFKEVLERVNQLPSKLAKILPLPLTPSTFKRYLRTYRKNLNLSN
jgi:hypothetical protein